MKKFTKNYLLSTLLLSFFCQVSLAQFQIIPLKKLDKIKPSSAKITALSLPFFDDFSTSTNRQDLSKWQNGGGVYINNTFTNNHPTLNVATFDGLNANGTPYDFVNSLSEGPTDTLTSLPIDLLGKTIADSLYLSFFYRGQGLGDKPDLRDSLRLQFLTDGNIWKTVWIDSAQTVSDKFLQVFIPIRANIYLHSGFQFRFQSYGRQSGQFDVWHLDYVYLDGVKNLIPNRRNFSLRDKDKNVTAIFTRDVATRNPINSFLKNYNAMPLGQLLADTTKELNKTVNYDLFFLGNDITFPVNYFFTVQNLLNNQFVQNDSQKQQNVSSLSVSTAISNISFAKQLINQSSVRLKMKFRTETADVIPFTVNDTISRIVDLDNYYAYDDGTAEQAAYLKKGFGRVAVQYIVNKPDAVSAIRINVQPTVTNLTGKRLTFQILANDKGKIGRILKTISDTTNVIKYPNTPNAFVEYKIDPVAVTDTFYVGFIQFTDDDPLTIGLDLNTPQFANKHYYNISNEWIQIPKVDAVQTNSTFVPIKGSLMIRPVMLGKTILEKPLANEGEIQDKNLVISPNPSTGIFRWNDESLKNAEVYDMTGRIVFQERTDNQAINLQNLHSGIYFLRLSNEKNTFVRKIVKE